MEILSIVLDYLQITWEDDALLRKLEGAVLRGEGLIDAYAGAPQDYTAPGPAQALLLDYCRYVRSDATEMFEINYRHDLINLREHAQAMALKAEEENAAD